MKKTVASVLWQLPIRKSCPARGWLLASSALRSTSADAAISTPSVIYRQRVQNKLVQEDETQLEALRLFDKLHTDLMAREGQKRKQVEEQAVEETAASSGWFSTLFSMNSSPTVPASSNNTSSIRSLYLYGDTGCGKTYLMDLFFDSLHALPRKRRIHFHEFMLDVHKRLHRIKQGDQTGQSAMSALAAELLGEWDLLCFDELQVTDIADAMVLRGLFSALFAQGLVLVATSNRAPDFLYHQGLQRELFMPFIQLLKQRALVFAFPPKGHKDYRALKYRELKQVRQVLWQHVVC
ncbi:cell division protein ZapE [archaeon]|nr:MAG: cell division protein ZapE [archaeon]